VAVILPQLYDFTAAETPQYSLLVRALDMDTPFSRFTPKALAFLRALKRNNDRDWFKARRISMNRSSGRR
jgi:hypothetical protein